VYAVLAERGWSERVVRVHLLVDLTANDDADEQPLKDVRTVLVDTIEQHTLWVGGPLRGEAQGSTGYDVTVVSFDVVKP
jgi:hypothetical protein